MDPFKVHHFQKQLNTIKFDFGNTIDTFIWPQKWYIMGAKYYVNTNQFDSIISDENGSNEYNIVTKGMIIRILRQITLNWEFTSLEYNMKIVTVSLSIT